MFRDCNLYVKLFHQAPPPSLLMQLLLRLRCGRPRHHQRATRGSIKSSRQFSVNKFHFLLPYFPVTAPCPTKLHSNRIIIIISMCRLLSSLSSRVSRLNPSPSVLDHQLHQPRIASFPCPAIPSLFPLHPFIPPLTDVPLSLYWLPGW